MTITTTAAHRIVMNNREEPRWLIHDLIGRTPALLYADPKVGKTHFALNMVASLLDGDEAFLDTQKVAGPVRCLYVALDRGGEDEITERLEGLTSKVAFITGSLNRDDIVKTVHGERIGFVVLDNVARILKDLENFNDPGSIAGLTDLVESLEDVGAAVLAVHHKSKPPSGDNHRSGGTPSGTFALMAYFRQLIEMTDKKIVLTSNYVKDGKQTFAIKAESEGEHGVRYSRDTNAKDSESRRTRGAKPKPPRVLDVRSAIVSAAGATTRAEAIAAITSAEPGADRGTVRRYVGEHATKWGLS